MGKRKIEIKKIEDAKARCVCFSKRRKGLFKKASHLSLSCDAQIAVLVFSMAGNPYALGTPDPDAVFDRYMAQALDLNEPTTSLAPPLPAAASNLSPLIQLDQINVDEFVDVEELQLLQKSLQNLKDNVLARVEEFKSKIPARAPADDRQDHAMTVSADLPLPVSAPSAEKAEDMIFGQLSPLDLGKHFVF